MSTRAPILEAMEGKAGFLPDADLPEIKFRSGTAVALSAVALGAGVLASVEKAEAAINIGASARCIGPNLAETTWSLNEAAAEDIQNTKVGVSYSASLNENNEAPELPEDKRKPLADILSSSRSGADGSANPPYNGEPTYSGSATLIQIIPNGKWFVNSYHFYDDPFTDFIDSMGAVSTPLDCSSGVPPVETPPPPPPVPEPTPLKILKPGLAMTTAKILPKNRRGKLAVTTSVSNDSTCSINGTGNGAHKNPKLRSQAARIEVKMTKATNVGNLPKGMIALFNGKEVKKGKKANMVSIDVRNSGLNPGNRQINQLNYQLLGKTGKFAGRLIVPGNRSDCGAAFTSTNLRAKSR